MRITRFYNKFKRFNKVFDAFIHSIFPYCKWGRINELYSKSSTFDGNTNFSFDINPVILEIFNAISLICKDHDNLSSILTPKKRALCTCFKGSSESTNLRVSKFLSLLFIQWCKMHKICFLNVYP